MNKILDNLQFRVYTDIVEKSEKDGKRRIRGYASTDALDRQGEVISIEALRQAANHLLENPTVFYEHKHDTYPVGLCVASKIDDKGLLVEVEISQTADTLWTLIQEGILNRFSIGGRVTSAEEKVDEDNKPYNEITGIELFEVSVVGLPANPEARFEVVNKSFSMVIADEIKKREEDSVAKKEIKKVEEVKVEPTKKVEDTVTDSQKKDLEKYEAEDKAKASEKPKEEKETTEKSEEAKSEEVVEKKIEKETVTEDKKVVEGEKVEEAVVEEKPAEEKVEEKPEIKVDNSIVTAEEFDKLVAEDISKPYPNEHAARIREPNEFQEGSFRSKPIAEGIRIIIGRLIGEETATVQAYRFHVDYFTAEEAKQWLKDHDITYILFEPATQEDSKQPEKKEEKTIVEDEAPEAGKEEIKTEEKPVEEKKEDKTVWTPVEIKVDEKLLELLDKLNDKLDAISEKINAIELANKAKAEEKAEEKKEEPKAEKKEDPKVEKEVKEEKPQRKSFIADAPYADDRKKVEEKNEPKKTTDKGWTQILYGRQK